MLLNVPKCHPFESPSSWLTRISLSQGERIDDLLNLFGLGECSDIDLELSLCPSNELMRFGIDLSKLYESRRIFCSFKSSGLSGDRFLLVNDRGRQKYRYCPICLMKMRNATIPVHWRFSSWCYCPLHGCLMEESCLNCMADLNLPVSQVSSGPGMRGVDSLGKCMVCSNKLWMDPLYFTWPILDKVFGSNAVRKFLHGRALLSALYFGHFKLKGSNGYSSISMVRHINEGYFFLNGVDMMDSRYFRERITSYLERPSLDLYFSDIAKNKINAARRRNSRKLPKGKYLFE